jgi:uncharacterized protein (TIGR03083 family)
MGRMLPLDDARTAIRREMAATLAVVDALDDAGWATPTRCDGWRVADLVAHLAWGQRLVAGGVAGMLAGRDTPELPDAVAADEPTALPGELRRAHEALVAELDRVGADDVTRPAPMPFGLVPTALLLQVVAMEVGVHGSDLRAALGGDDGLADDVVRATAVVLGAFLPALASATRPAAPVAYRLAGEVVDLTLAFAGDAWTVAGDTGTPAVTLAGADSDLCLFALGRGTIDERRLHVDGDPEAAARFRDHFPGI